MALLRRVRSVTTGVAGTPWYTNTYMLHVVGGGQACVDAVHAFWLNMAGSLDNSNVVTVEGDTAIVDDGTGDIVGIDSVTTKVASLTGATAALPPANQMVIHLLTSNFIGGRQIRGKMFIPGLLQTAADVNGAPVVALKSAVLGHVNTLRTALATPGQWVVYSRKNGVSAVVQSASTPSQFAVLRSRRD